MAIVTTDSIANPKPVRGVNWAGNPIQDGEDYWGKLDNPKPLSNESTTKDESSVRKVKRMRKAKAWSAERRTAYAARMREWWAARKAQSPPQT